MVICGFILEIELFPFVPLLSNIFNYISSSE